MAKYWQTMREAIIGSMLLLILIFIIVLLQFPVHQTPEIPSQVYPNLTKTIPVTAPSKATHVNPETKPLLHQSKVFPFVSNKDQRLKSPQTSVTNKITRKLAEPILSSDKDNIPAAESSADNLYQPAMIQTLQNNPEPADIPNEINSSVPDSTKTIVNQPARAPDLQPSPEPTHSQVTKESDVSLAVSAPPSVQTSTEASKLPATSTLPSTSSEKTKAELFGSTEGTIIGGGTIAAVALAPIAAPVSIVVGITIGVYSKIQEWAHKSNTKANFKIEQDANPTGKHNANQTKSVK